MERVRLFFLKNRELFSNEKVTTLFFIILSSALFIFPRIKIITEYTLDGDELLSWLLIEKSFTGMWAEVYRAVMQPLYYTILKLWMFISPENNDYWIRVPSIILSCLASILVALQVRKVSDWLIATIIFILFSNLDWVVMTSTMSRSYPLLLFLSSIHVYFFKKVIAGTSSSRDYNAFTFLSIAILFTHNTSIFYISSCFLLLIFSGHWKKLLEKKINILFLVSLLVYLVVIYFQFINYRSKVSWIGKSSWDFTYLDPILITYLISLIFVFFKYKTTNRKLIVFSSVPLVGYFLYLFVDTFLMSIFVQRYFVVFYPLMTLVIAEFIRSLMNVNVGKVIILLIVSVQFGSYRITPYRDFYEYKIDYKHFFKNLKDREVINNRTSVQCVVIDSYEAVLSPYSKMYLGRDVCNYISNEAKLDADIILVNDISKAKILMSDLNLADNVKYRPLVVEDNIVAFERYE
ncbi:putative membrane protein [Halobacteriovorax marinus SJ]|uniref:Membrane protein n=1 Tax=Halobacteriovorax marinus (strain ATCC BAA-682 / DSM 15412 / SJ) TaxID=862908 RepID=E1WZU9_HALMS|nr:glycosyltransferase family 39 protein [Halobacteriovorax marinus]CBW27885.1 putative membrane protein [Halobacteriovorax marinus SJ]